MQALNDFIDRKLQASPIKSLIVYPEGMKHNPCPALPCPALPCPALPCPALPCPAYIGLLLQFRRAYVLAQLMCHGKYSDILCVDFSVQCLS